MKTITLFMRSRELTRNAVIDIKKAFPEYEPIFEENLHSARRLRHFQIAKDQVKLAAMTGLFTTLITIGASQNFGNMLINPKGLVITGIVGAGSGLAYLSQKLDEHSRYCMPRLTGKITRAAYLMTWPFSVPISNLIQSISNLVHGMKIEK